MWCKPCRIHSECVDHQGLYSSHPISMGGVQDSPLARWVLKCECCGYKTSARLRNSSFFTHSLESFLSQFNSVNSLNNQFCIAFFVVPTTLQGSIPSGVDQDHSINGFSLLDPRLCVFFIAFFKVSPTEPSSENELIHPECLQHLLGALSGTILLQTPSSPYPVRFRGASQDDKWRRNWRR